MPHIVINNNNPQKFIKMPKVEIIQKQNSNEITNNIRNKLEVKNEKENPLTLSKEKEQEEMYNSQRSLMIISQISQNRAINNSHHENNKNRYAEDEENNFEIIENKNSINHIISDSMVTNIEEDQKSLNIKNIKLELEKSIGKSVFDNVQILLETEKDIDKSKKVIIKELISQKCSKSQIDLALEKIDEIMKYNKNIK